MLRELRFLGPFVRPYRAGYALGAACVVGTIVLKIWIPRLLGNTIDAIDPGAPGSSGASAAADASRIATYALWIVVLAVSSALLRTASRVILLGNCRRIVHDLRNRLFGHLVRLDPDFYVRTPTGHLMSRAINDMNNVQGLTGPVFLYVAETASLFAAALVFLVGIDPGLTLLAVLPFPFFIWGTRRLAGRIQQGSREAQHKLSEVSAKVDESLSGQHVIKALVLEDVDLGRFEQHCSEYRRLNLVVARARALLLPTMITLGSLSTVVVLAVGGPRVARGELSIGDFAAMILYLHMMAAPTGTLGFVISSLQRGAAALGRIREVFEIEPGLIRSSGAEPGPRTASLAVRGLSIRYGPLAEEPHLSGSLPEGLDPELLTHGRTVLDDVSFELPAGRTLGIVGPTGAGKTTLLRALARQLEVPRGTVLVDGRDVCDLSLAELRRAIGYVPQEAFLFSETLAQNVALGRPDASREAIERAAETAQLSKDVPQIPNGYEAVLGERGVNLSGGQRQRAALARVVLLEPAVLLLDDTLSAVDADTADEILRRLRPLMDGKTTVIVAHRIASVMHADEILVLDEGRVVERGTHAELVENGGLYASLYERQRSHEQLAADLGLDSTADREERVS